MNISFTYSDAPSIVNKLASVIYKADANGNPTGSIVASQEFNPPHNSPRNVTFTNLEPVVYVVNTYETPGLPVLGQLRNSFVYNPEFSDLDIKVVSLRMVEGETSYNVPDVPANDFYSWDGYRVLTINQRGVGNFELEAYDKDGNILNPDTREASVRDKPDDDPKGFDVLIPDFSFGDGERVDVTLISRITTRIPTYNITKVVYDDIYLTNDSSVSSADTNKGIHLQGASNVFAFTVNLPQISTLTPYSCFFPFISDGGSHINVTLKAYSDSSVTDKIFYHNPSADQNTPAKFYRNTVHLGQCERFTIYNNDSGWVVVFDGAPGILGVGQLVDSYSRIGLNQIFTDGSAGLLRTTYRRVWEWIQTLEAGTVVSQTTWNSTAVNNKGFFHSGDGSTTFGIPQLYSTGYARPVDGASRKPGSFLDDTVRDHYHAMFTQNEAGAGVPINNARPILIRNGNSGGNANYDMRGRASTVNSATVLPDLGQSSSPYIKRNGVYVNEYFDANGTAKTGAPTETKGKDFGVYKLLNI